MFASLAIHFVQPASARNPPTAPHATPLRLYFTPISIFVKRVLFVTLGMCSVSPPPNSIASPVEWGAKGA